MGKIPSVDGTKIFITDNDVRYRMVLGSLLNEYNVCVVETGESLIEADK